MLQLTRLRLTRKTTINTQKVTIKTFNSSSVGHVALVQHLNEEKVG